MGKRGRWPRRRWLLVLAVLLVAGCAGRYVNTVPDGSHQFLSGDQAVDVPVKAATLLGWILPPDQAVVMSVQFSPDGRSLYVLSTRGVCEQLGSASVTRTQTGTISVDIRLTGCPPLPLAGDAAAWFFAAVISLDPAVDPGHPPRVVDASTGAPVKVEPYLP